MMKGLTPGGTFLLEGASYLTWFVAFWGCCRNPKHSRHLQSSREPKESFIAGNAVGEDQMQAVFGMDRESLL